MEKISSTHASIASHPILTRLQNWLAAIGYFILPECLYESRLKRPIGETSWLDGLRGVAALLVVLQHMQAQVNMGMHQCYHYPETSALSFWPIIRLFFSGGSFAVILFFFISGKHTDRKSYI